MAAKKKPAEKKETPKKKGKYDITVKTGLSFEELVKLAATTPKNPTKKK